MGDQVSKIDGLRVGGDAVAADEKEREEEGDSEGTEEEGSEEEVVSEGEEGDEALSSATSRYSAIDIANEAMATIELPTTPAVFIQVFTIVGVLWSDISRYLRFTRKTNYRGERGCKGNGKERGRC